MNIFKYATIHILERPKAPLRKKGANKLLNYLILSISPRKYLKIRDEATMIIGW